MPINLFSFKALGHVKVTVWYCKSLAKDMALTMALGRTAEINLPDNFELTDTHTPVVEYFTANTDSMNICEQAFHYLQCEVWSPKGEARGLIESLEGINHTSMSMGDIVQIDSRFFICQMIGFVEIFQMVNNQLIVSTDLSKIAG